MSIKGLRSRIQLEQVTQDCEKGFDALHGHCRVNLLSWFDCFMFKNHVYIDVLAAAHSAETACKVRKGIPALYYGL